MSLTVDALDHLVINVSDVDAATDWYSRVLGMTRVDFDPGQGKAKRVSMKFGRQKINLRPIHASKDDWFTANHEASGSDDLCFLTSASPQDVMAHLSACHVVVEEGPVKKQGAVGTLNSVYCRDPDGSLIEISSYDA